MDILEKLWKMWENIMTLNFNKWNDIKKWFGVRTRLSYYKVFHRKSTSNKNEKPHILMIKTVYLGLSILELGKASI